MLGSRAFRARRSAARTYLHQRLRETQGDTQGLLAELEREFGEAAPARSRFYDWVREWRVGREPDRSSLWTLASDKTGDPELVLIAIADRTKRMWARYDEDVRKGVTPRLDFGVGDRGEVLGGPTHLEATWLARVARAFPFLAQRTEDGVLARGALLWRYALEYADLDLRGASDVVMARQDRAATQEMPLHAAADPTKPYATLRVHHEGD